jgi:hypothetical protein
MTGILVRTTIVLCSILSLAGPVAAAELARTPVSGWVVDYAEHQCVASRKYGDAKNTVFLVLKPSPMRDVMQIAWIEKSGSFGNPTQFPATIQIDGNSPIPISVLGAATKDGGVTYRTNVPSKDFAPARIGTKISLSGIGRLKGSFALTQMPALMKELDACVDDLRRVWNVEPADQSKLLSRAGTNDSVARLFSTSDYPGISLQNEESGTVGVLLLVDEKGKVADCTVSMTSNIAVLDAQTCVILLTRAKLEPAVGQDGRPARDSTSARIKWVMPD